LCPFDQESTADERGQRAVAPITQRSLHRGSALEYLVEPLDSGAGLVAYAVAAAGHQQHQVTGLETERIVQSVDLEPTRTARHEMERRDVPRLDGEAPRCAELGPAVDGAADPKRAQHVGDGIAVEFVDEPFHHTPLVRPVRRAPG
jgi:hypothetical protein